MADWSTQNIPSQTRRRAIVTGANGGIGIHIATELARAGAKVVLACRTLDKALETAIHICREVPSAQLEPAQIDVSSLASVHAFAQKQTAQPLHMLIHNAGVMGMPRRQVSPDGYELHLATHCIGPFAMTEGLFPALLAASTPQQPARVVMVNSLWGNFVKLPLDDLQSERSYKPTLGAYAGSKLAQLVFATEFDRRLKAAGLPIFSATCHAGYTNTTLQTRATSRLSRMFYAVMRPFASQTPAQGALHALFTATSPDAKSGGYYGPARLGGCVGPPVPAPISKEAQSPEKAHRLWNALEHLSRVYFPVEPTH